MSRRAIIIVLATLVFLPAPAHAGQGVAPSCGEVRAGFREVYGQALEASNGRVTFTRCWRTRGAGTAMIARVRGSAPMRLRVRMWPMDRSAAPDYWFSVRTPTAADDRAARRAQAARDSGPRRIR